MAVFDRGVFDNSTFDAGGGFSVSAIILTQSPEPPGSFVVSAEIVVHVEESFSAASTLLRTQEFPVTLNARIYHPNMLGSFTVNACIGAFARVSQVPLEVLIQPWNQYARVSQVPLEVLVQPWNQYARVSQVVIEVLLPRTNGHIHVDSTIAKTAESGFLVQAAIGTGAGFDVDATFVPLRFGVDAIRSKAGSGSLTVAATKAKTFEKAFAASAVLFVNQSGKTFTVEATLTLVVVHPILVDAFVQPYFFLGAWLDLGFNVNALVLSRISRSFTVNAVKFGPRSGSFIVRSIHRETFPGSFEIDYEWVPAHFLVDATILATVTPSLGLTVDCLIGGYSSSFTISAVIFATVGPALRPLTFPGTSRTRGGLTANALSPVFPINSGEQAVVVVASPPSDGGDLGIASTLNVYAVSTDLGEHDAVVEPGQYYVFSYKGNVYRPSLTGSGSYKDWGISTLQFTVGAYIQPFFTIDARFVWTFGSTFTVEATQRRVKSSTFTLAAFIQPYFFVDALVASLHFHIDAWIKCEFTVNAWIIRKVSGSFSVNAFVRGYFRVNAVKRRTQLKSLTVGSWFTNPVFGNFTVSAWIQPHFSVSATKGYTRYWQGKHGIKIDAWKEGGTGSSFTLDAEIRPYFTTDATVLGTRERTFSVASYLSNAKYGSLTVDAFIEGWFRVDAVLFAPVDNEFTCWSLDSAIVFRPQGSTTLDASITGFLVNAVVKGTRKFIFSIFALYGRRSGSGSFGVFAEKYAASAYWDPYDEEWLYPHFYVDALKMVHRSGSFSVGAAIIFPGQPIISIFADASIINTQSNEFLLEAEIDPLYQTVVYDGYRDVSKRVLRNVGEHLVFPGISMVLPEGSTGDNVLYGPFWPLDYRPVTLTVWDTPSGPEASIGIVSLSENLWVKINERVQGPGITEVVYGDTTTITFWPSYDFEPYYVYVWTKLGAYQPDMTGEAMIAYPQYDNIFLSRAAPTIDAWFVGTMGDFTLNAEIIGIEKYGAFNVNAEMCAQGEKRGALLIDSLLLSTRKYIFLFYAQFSPASFSLNAVIRQPQYTIDAFIQPYFVADAVVTKNILKHFHIDYRWILPTKFDNFAIDADVRLDGDMRGAFTLDFIALAGRRGRFYLAAHIYMAPATFSVDAKIASWMLVDAWIETVAGGLGGFSVGAYIRGGSYIIFPGRTVMDGVINRTFWFTSDMASFTYADEGSSIEGPGIPPGTVIVTVVDAVSVIMSNAATSTATGIVVSIGVGKPTDPFGNPPAIRRGFRVKIDAGFAEPSPSYDHEAVNAILEEIGRAKRRLEDLLCIKEPISAELEEISRLNQLIADLWAEIAAIKTGDPSAFWWDRMAHVQSDIDRYMAIPTNRRTAQQNDALSRARASLRYAVSQYRGSNEIVRTWEDVTGDCIWSQTDFTQMAKTGPGHFTITMKGAKDRFIGGEEIHFEIDDLRVFGGWVTSVERGYFFSDFAQPKTVIHGVDFNILFDRLAVRNYPWEFANHSKTAADNGEYRNWKPYKIGTMDDDLIRRAIGSYLLPDLPVGFDYITNVDPIMTPAPVTPWVMPEAGSTFRMFMQSISQITTAVWWIDPYMALHYHNRGTVSAPYPLTDGVGGISSRGLTVSTDISMMVNDAILWGVLAKTPEGKTIYWHELGDGTFWSRYWQSEIDRLNDLLSALYKIPPDDRTDAQWRAIAQYIAKIAIDKARKAYVEDHVWDPDSGLPRPADAQIDSILHWGRWQVGESREDIYHEIFLDRRAHSMIVRYDEPIIRATATVWDPGYQAGQVVQVLSSVYGIAVDLVITSLHITFSVQMEPVGGVFYALPRYDLTMGLDPEGPWTIFDYLPYPNQGTPGVGGDTT